MTSIITTTTIPEKRKNTNKFNGEGNKTSTMSADQFFRWRKNLSLKQKDAAVLLGLQKRMIQYYEKGSRNGKPVMIPKSVRLACYALEQGIEDYDGSQTKHINMSLYRKHKNNQS